MKIQDIMTREVIVVSPEGIDSARRRRRCATMISDFSRSLTGSKLLGVLSDRDMAVRSIAEGRDPGNTVSRDAITQPVICCYSDQEVSEGGAHDA